MSLKTTLQDTDAGFRTAWSWFGGGLAGYPTGPLYSWKLPYVGLSETERATLEAFHATVQGRFNSFIFLDPAGNLCPYSEDFTNAAWAMNSVSVTAPGGTPDPFGGTAASILTSNGANASIDTYVLPAGNAAGFVLCGSVWVKAAAAAQSLFIGFIDSAFAVLASRTWQVPANAWTRISCQVTLSTQSSVRLLIGGGATWPAGIGLSLFGAQCVPGLGPGGYAKTPGDYGYHQNVRLDSDELEWTKPAYNQNSVTVLLREFYAP